MVWKMILKTKRDFKNLRQLREEGQRNPKIRRKGQVKTVGVDRTNNNQTDKNEDISQFNPAKEEMDNLAINTRNDLKNLTEQELNKLKETMLNRLERMSDAEIISILEETEGKLDRAGF